MKNSAKNLTENAQKFLAKNPTLLETKWGYSFYEHPTLGDETDIKMITPDGKYKSTDCYDMESIHEWLENEIKYTIKK